MKIKTKKSWLLAVALMTGFASANFYIVVKENYKITKGSETPDPEEPPIYDDTNNKELDFPEGHVMVAWVGTGYVQSNVNKKTKVYLTKDVANHHRYASDWYGGHNTGEYTTGDWEYHGIAGSLGSVNHGIVVKSSKNYDNKEVKFPIGHVIVAWVGNGYVQSNINKTTGIYLITDNENHNRYGSDWYGNYNSGVYLEGTWQYRGHVSSLGNVTNGLFVRIN